MKAVETKLVKRGGVLLAPGSFVNDFLSIGIKSRAMHSVSALI